MAEQKNKKHGKKDDNKKKDDGVEENIKKQPVKITKALPLVPLRDLIIFPNMMVQLFVSREKSIAALEEAVKTSSEIILVTQKDATSNNISLNNIYSSGVMASLVQLLRMPDGIVKVLVEGKKRGVISNINDGNEFFTADFLEKKEFSSNEKELDALSRAAKTAFEAYARLHKQVSPASLMRVSSIEDPAKLSDVIAGQVNLKLDFKQELLSLFDINKRLEYLIERVQGEIDVLEAEKRIRARVKNQVKKSQKEYYLNEQMQAIQKELSDGDDSASEIEELEQKLAAKKMSKEAHKKVTKELKRLKSMSPMSAESGVIRSYVDWMLDLPWDNYIKESIDIKAAQKILDRDHWGLEKVKERIIEHLSIQYLTKTMNGPILCLVGPPGVGKTSLAESIAKSLNRPFARISLGGVRDEAEIRGHRRTYVGAMPGKIIQTLKKCEYNNPLILLDEIDKMATDFRGDPSSALLEVLDPSQNHTFSDHYLEVEYDLSKVMFLATANSLHTMNRPLLDRLEILSLDGYIEKEKFNIGKQYLAPKQLKKSGLEDRKVNLSDAALKDLIHYYTREAGVRNLERVIAKTFRKLAKEIVSDEFKLKPAASEKPKPKTRNKTATAAAKKSAKLKQPSYNITSKKLVDLLGDHIYKSNTIEKQNEIGLTNGMAYTTVGGDLLPIEVSSVPGNGKFIITGQLGDVMKESCTAAMSYVRSRGPLFGLDKEVYANTDIHIHVPEGAIPKDGPSAGLAITTSIVSSLLKIPVLKTVAMTGEVTLRGRALPIGGLREKVLAAHRGGIKIIIIPKENQKDLKDIPKEVIKGLQVVLVDHVDQVLVKALAIKNPKEVFKQDKIKEHIGLRAQHVGYIENSKAQ
ncbi:MAG: endopeptidase La [Bdellovibrionales bacterium]|nr:endopeptidase La [Bdellovibrionales bacterium]